MVEVRLEEFVYQRLNQSVFATPAISEVLREHFFWKIDFESIAEALVAGVLDDDDFADGILSETNGPLTGRYSDGLGSHVDEATTVTT